MRSSGSGGFFDLPGLAERKKNLEEEASRPGFWDDPEKARRAMAERNRVEQDIALCENLRREAEDLAAHLELAREIGRRPGAEAEAEKEGAEVRASLEKLSEKVRRESLRTKMSDPNDARNAIVSLHAGAGGTEAMDWCQMLLRMYMRWCERRGYEVRMADLMPGEEAGVKSCTFLVRGPYAYGFLKSENGVHRLVRISPFDANKRRHTSFAAADVIPEIEDDVRVEIRDADLRVDTFRASGHGGQHLQKTDSAVRITHLPTGVVVQCQSERSQGQNRETAMKLLRARLYELEMEKRRSALEKHYDEKGQIAWGHQIRSYVFMPYQLVKDLRTGYETGDIRAVMDGDLDGFLEAYLDWSSSRRTGAARD